MPSLSFIYYLLGEEGGGGLNLNVQILRGNWSNGSAGKVHDYF